MNQSGGAGGTTHELPSRFVANSFTRTSRHFPFWLGFRGRPILKYEGEVGPKVFWNIG